MTRPIIGESRAMRRSLETLERVAPTDVTLLILGETGTGKELVARAVHERSARKGGPFVAVNCAALPESLIESELFGHEAGAFTGAHRQRRGRIAQASGGTLFLDEVGDLAPVAQAKLLRALQERVVEPLGGNEAVPVDIRLVAATNRDVRHAGEESVRRDLFFRLSVVTLLLPPLREREGDVERLLEHFLERASRAMGREALVLSPAARRTLLAHDWPGNVRELENTCTRLAAICPPGSTVEPAQLELPVAEPPPASAGLVPRQALREILDYCEREIVRRVLERCGGNRSQAARELGISRQAMQQKLARLR